MANSIEIPVSLALNQAQEQIAQLRKALQEGLDPKSSEFKTIIGMIEQATNRAEHLKATMQSSFSTSSGAKKFSNEMQKTFDLINTIVGRMKNVDTKNLLFSEEDQEKIKNIHTEIEKTEKALAELKAGKIGTFFEGNVKKEFKDLGDLAKTLFSNLQKMSFTQLGEGLEKESKRVQESLDKIQEKIKSITSVQGKVSGDTNSDPFSILKTTTLTTVTPKVNRLIIDNLKNSLKQTFQEYNELFDIKSLTANLNKITQKDVQNGSALTLQTNAIEAAVKEAINKLKTEKNKYQQALEELNNVQTSGFGRDANGNKVSSRVAQEARENAALQARNIVQKLGIDAPERNNYEFVSDYVQRLKDKVGEESTKFVQETQASLEQKGEQLKGAVTGVFKTAFSEFEINDSKGFQARVKEWLMGDLKLTELGPELTNAITQMTKGTNVDEAFSILGNALKNSLSNSLAQLGGEETEAKAKAEALTNAMKTLGLVAQDNDGKIKLNEKSLEDLKKTLEELLGQKLGDFTNMIPVPDPKRTYEAENALTQYINRLKELETRQKSLSNVQMAVKQWMGFYQVLNLGKKAITDMKNHIQELDSVMTQIAVVTNMSQSDLWNQIGQYSQIARQYGVAIKGVYEVSQIYYQQGLEQNDVMTLTTETLKMARIAGLDYATAADYMTTAIRGFKLEMSDASHVTDVYSALAATTASSTEELAVAISKTASSAEAVGASFEATSAMMATMIATTRESATNIGTALKSVISRYGEMTKDPSKLVDSEGEEMSLNRVDTALQSIGITIHDVNGQFRDFDDVILELGKKWNTIDKNAQRYIATLMAGNRQQSRFLALVSNIDEYEKALATAQSAEGTGEVQTLKTLDSIDARLEKMKVTIQEFYTSSGLEDLYKGVLDIITNIFDAANHLPKLFDKIPVTALAVGGTIINVIKNVLSLIVAEISAAMDTAKSNIDLTITKRIAKAKEDGRQVGKAYKEGEIQGEQEVATGASVKTGIGKQLLSIGARAAGAVLSAAGAGFTISGLNQYGSSLTKEQDRAAGGATLGGALLGIGGSTLTGLATGGPVGAAIGAITGLISNIGTLTSAFSMLNVSTARQIELAEKRLEKAKQEEATSKNEVKNLETAYNKLIELQKHQYDSIEDAKAYAEYMNQLGDTYPKFIESLSTSGDIIISVTAMEYELAKARETAATATIQSLQSERDVLEKRNEAVNDFSQALDNEIEFSPEFVKTVGGLVKTGEMLPIDFVYQQYKNYLSNNKSLTDEERKTLYEDISGINYATYNEKEQTWEEQWDDLVQDIIQQGLVTTREAFYDMMGQHVTGSTDKILKAIQNYISIDGNENFLDQFDIETKENQTKFEAIKSYSYDELFNLATQIRERLEEQSQYNNQVANSLTNTIEQEQTKAAVQKEINKLTVSDKLDSKTNGQILQKYLNFISSLMGTEKNVERYFDGLSELILKDTITADKLMNLDYTNFSNFKKEDLPEAWQEYFSIFYNNFQNARDKALDEINNWIDEIKELKLDENVIKIETKEDGASLISSDLITKFIPELQKRITDYTNLKDKGLFSDARIYGEGLVNFFNSISNISDEAQLKISSIVKEIDFSDSESLRSAAEKLKTIDFVDAKDKEAVEQAAENLESAAKQYIINVSTLLVQLKETTTDTAKALETAFDNQTKALSRSEAMKAAQELLKGYTGSYSNLDWDKLYEYNSELGGYVANQAALEIAISKATDEATTKLKDINNQIINYNSLIEFFGGEKGLGTTLTQYLKITDENERASFRNSEIQSLNAKGLNGAELMSLFDQMAQQAKGYESVEKYLEEHATKEAEQVAEAQAEIEFATQEAAIDWLRKQKYEDIAGGSYTQTGKSNIKKAFQEIFKGKMSDEKFDLTFEGLWSVLENGEFDRFDQLVKILAQSYDIDIPDIISELLFPKGKESELKQKQTALSEVLSKIPYASMSQATQNAIGDPAYTVDKALETAQKLLADIEQTSEQGKDSKEYKEALAQIWQFIQSEDKAASLINQIRDGQISATEEIFSQIVDGNGNLIDKVKDFLEIDKENGTIKFQKGISLEDGAERLAKALNISLSELKLTDFYKNFLSGSIDQEIKDLDANDVSKQMLSQLQTLSSAKTGDRVRIDKLPAGIQKKLSSVIDDTYKVTSEFQLQAILAGLNANDFGNDAAAQQWIKQYKQEVESKKPVQQQALQNIIASSFSMDQAKSYLKSVYQSIDWDSFSDEGIITQMKTEGFNWDPFTKSFTNTIESINKINNIIEKYIEQGLATPEDINNLKAMLSQLEYQIGDGRKYSSLSNIIENSEAVSDEMIAELKTAYNLTDSDIKSIFGTKRSDNTFKANVALLLKTIGGGFTDLANKASDAYINNIQSILSMVSNGTTSIDEMSKFAETFGVDAKTAFSYDNDLGAWKLDASQLKPLIEKQAEELKKNGLLTKDDVDSWVKKQIDSITVDQIDIQGILSAGTEKDKKKYINILTDYYKTQLKDAPLAEGFAKLQAEKTFDVIRQGGQAAVDKIKEIKGDNVTVEDIEAAYNYYSDLVISAMDLLEGDIIGKFVTDEQKLLLAEHGVSIDDNNMITSVDNLVEAYESLYQAMKDKNQSSMIKLNEAYAKVLDAEEQEEADAIDTLSNAMGMSFSSLGKLIGEKGYDLKDIADRNAWAEFGLERIGGKKVRINSFEALANKMDWDYGSEEYINAYDTYIDALITARDKTRKSILEEAKAIADANPGDTLNLTQMYNAAKKAVVPEGYNGNVDLANRAIVDNHDGSYSTIVGQGIVLDQLDKGFGAIFATIGMNEEEVKQYVDKLQNTAKEMKEKGDTRSYVEIIKELDSVDNKGKGILIEALQGEADSIQDVLNERADFFHRRQAAYYDFIATLKGWGAEFSEDGILKLQDDADVYHILQTIYTIAENGELLLVDDLAELRDALDQVLKGFSDTLSKGIEGKLSEVELNDLLEKSSNLLNIDLDDSDFTRTAEGYKIAERAAISLYTQLEKIDSIQSRIIFNDLNKNLKESNEHYRTTRDILGRIKDLRTQIKSLEGTKNTAKIEQYKEELALAEKIAQVRTVTEDDSYKFMDNKLEGGLANAANYFNAWGNAQKAWNEAIQDAQDRQKAFKEKTSTNNDFSIYLGIDDFKNIVEELNRLAGQNGKEIEFLGHKLNGELSSASELIQAGLDTVVFDGDSAKVNLSQLGVSLLDGGKLLNKSSKEAIREFAQSQITIIDGLIGITDTIIAFEEIGKIDVNENGQLDIGEVFKTKDGYGITDQLNDQLTKLIGNEGTAKVLSNIKLSTGTLLDLFKAATNGEESLYNALEKLGLDREEFIKLLETLAKKRDWGDENGADLVQLLEQVIGETGVMTYDASNTKQVVKIEGKPNIVVDWEQNSTKQALEQLKSSEGKEKEHLIAAIKRYEQQDNGLDINNTGEARALMAVLRYKGIITDIKVDNEDGEVIITYNGKEYKGKSRKEVLQKALLEEGGAQIIATDTGSEQLMGAITFGSAAIKMVLGDNGKITYSLDVGNGEPITGNSLDAIKEQYINHVMTSDGTKTQQEVELDWNTKINMNSSVVGEISQGIRDALEAIGANLNTPLIVITPEKTKFRIPKGEEPSVENSEDVPTEVNAPEGKETITISYSELTAMLKEAGIQNDQIQPILDGLNENWEKNGDTPIEITYESLETALKSNGVNDTVLPNIKRLWAAWHDPSYSKVVVDVNTLEAKLTSQGFTDDQVKAAIGAAKTGWETEGGKAVEIKPESLTAALSSGIDDSAINSAITAAQKQWKENGEKPVDVYPNLNIVTTKTITDENGEQVEVSIIDQLLEVINNLDDDLTSEQKTVVIRGLALTLSEIKDLTPEEQTKLQTVLDTAANKLNLPLSASLLFGDKKQGLLTYLTGLGVPSKVINALFMPAQIQEALNSMPTPTIKANLEFNEDNPEEKNSFKNPEEKPEEKIVNSSTFDINQSQELLLNEAEERTSAFTELNNIINNRLNEINLNSDYNNSNESDNFNLNIENLSDEIDELKITISNLEEEYKKATERTDKEPNQANYEKEIQIESKLGEARNQLKEKEEALTQLNEKITQASKELQLLENSYEEIIEKTGLSKEQIADAVETLNNLDPKNPKQIADILKTLNPNKAKNISTLLNNLPTNRIQQIQNLLSNLKAALNIVINVSAVASEGEAVVEKAQASGSFNSIRWGGGGKSNINLTATKAMAKGSRRTLMGELGPELVVSGGRYYVVGQNGAEMVDLDPDAIVFNHLQTKKLLSSGHAGRGKPVTNEKVATSLATGNVTGPAMASASEIREALKAMKALWENLLSASSRALGSLAGLATKNSSKNKGSGSNKDNDAQSLDPGYIHDLERWYNLLRQIDKLEKDISYQEQLRSKIESDRVINGKAYYDSQKENLKQLENEIATRHQLASLQKDQQEKTRQELQNSPLGKIITINEEGVLQYNNNAVLGEGTPYETKGGLTLLAKLNARNPDNSPVYSAKEQYKMIEDLDLAKYITHDNQGNEIQLHDKDGNIRDEFFTESMAAFYDWLDGAMDEYQNLSDSRREQEEKILEAETKRNEILQNIVDNQLAVEDKVYKAITDLKESEIESARKEKEALEKSSQNFIDGLNNQLNKEREMYKNNEDENELNKLRRQLSILQRSGGSASQIQSLQDQIEAKEQDAYFNAQQQQIDSIKEASDLQIKKMDEQINIMEETLEYQKAQGLLWGQVAEIMSGSSESITQFITMNTKEWSTFSPTKQGEEFRTLNGQVSRVVAYLSDDSPYRVTDEGTEQNVSEAITGTDSHEWADFNDAMGKELGESWNEIADKAREVYNEHLEATGDPNFAASKVLEMEEVKNLIDKNEGEIILDHPDISEFNSSDNEPIEEDSGSSSGSSGGGYGGGNYSSSSYEAPTPATKTTTTTPKKKEQVDNTKQIVAVSKRYYYDENTHWKMRRFKQGGKTGYEKCDEGPHIYSGVITNGTKCSVCGRKLTSYSPISTTSRPNNSAENYDPRFTTPTPAPQKKPQVQTNNNNNNNNSNTKFSSSNSKVKITVYHLEKDTKRKLSDPSTHWRKQGEIIYGKDVANPNIINGGYAYYESSPYNLSAYDGAMMTCYYYKKVQSVMGKSNPTGRKSSETITSFSTGGTVDYTGLAMVHGSKTRPEEVLNADETKMWREKILSGHSNSLTNQLLNFQNLVNGLSMNLSGVNNNTTNEGNVTIERVEVNMNAMIANDYDAKRAGQNAFEEMMKIARKSGAQSIRR